MLITDPGLCSLCNACMYNVEMFTSIYIYIYMCLNRACLQLWALLHFIMPTLFDSHDEFNEWFSKDIESHAERQSGIDESE